MKAIKTIIAIPASILRFSFDGTEVPNWAWRAFLLSSKDFFRLDICWQT